VAAAQQPGTASAGLLFWILYHDDYQDYDGFGIYYPDPRHASTVALIKASHQALGNLQRNLKNFIRGDTACDGAVDIADPVAALEYLFLRGEPGCCLDAADANGDGAIDIADPVATLIYLFLGTAAPPLPFPLCGLDADLEQPDLGCAAYPPCGR
jgi:hypothetical protein